MAHLKDLIDEQGDMESVEALIYRHVDEKITAFHRWLDTQTQIPAPLREIHLGNVHLMVELLAETPPFIFPEEITDDEAGDETGEESTATAFKYFVYHSYIRLGPRDTEMSRHLLDSVELYFTHLSRLGEIDDIPDVVTQTVGAPEVFAKRMAAYQAFNAKHVENDDDWIRAFDQWSADFYDL